MAETQKNEPFHMLDLDFTEDLRVKFLSLFPSYQEQLLDRVLIKESLEDYSNAGEATSTRITTVADKFWLQSQGSVKYFLLHEKKYKCQGTQVWLQPPEKGDVAEWYDDLISQYSSSKDSSGGSSGSSSSTMSQSLSPVNKPN